VFDLNGAPRLMKLGTIASPWRYDLLCHAKAAETAMKRACMLRPIQPINLDA
jgi:hypothetical protein